MELGVALIAGLVGALTGFLLQVFISVRSTDLLTISDQIADLKRIEEYGVTYWLTHPKEEGECKRNAAKLRGALAASSSFEEHGPEILGCRYQKYMDLVLKLDNTVTGGPFESERKDIDPARASACMRIVGELISHLRTCRKYVFLWK